MSVRVQLGEDVGISREIWYLGPGSAQRGTARAPEALAQAAAREFLPPPPLLKSRLFSTFISNLEKGNFAADVPFCRMVKLRDDGEDGRFTGCKSMHKGRTPQMSHEVMGFG